MTAPPSRPAAERGTGLIGTIAGVTVFLALLTVTLQILLHLSATSTVQTAAYEAARLVATADGVIDGRVLAAAEDQARQVLGGLGEGATFTWQVTDPSVVVLVLASDGPDVLAPVVIGLLGDRRIERTVRVRREALQP